MKTCTAFAVLLVLGAVPARAQDDDRLAALRGEIELAEVERDVDRELLREAMLMVGRATMRQAGTGLRSEEAQKRFQAETAALKEFIDAKKAALVKRSAELKKKAAELSSLEMGVAVRRVTRPNPAAKPGETALDDKDRQGLIETLEKAQVELQLLQTQSPMYQQPLNDALNALAAAEFEAANDDTRREKADAARKRFDKIKGKYVEFNKKLWLEQERVSELRGRLGVGGMGGMGGGMR